MNDTKKALLEALTAEQHNGIWWVTPTDPEKRDDELTQARRRRELAQAEQDYKTKEAR